MSVAALRGLSVLLGRLPETRGTGSIQEVQCLYTKGYEILVATNSYIEATGLASALGAAGLKDQCVLGDLRPAYLALRNEMEQARKGPANKTLLSYSGLWTGTYYDGMEALATWGGWADDITKLVAGDAETVKIAKRGYRMFFSKDDIPKKYLPSKASEPDKQEKSWKPCAAGGKVIAVNDLQLKLHSSPKYGDKFLHAEQTLLLCLADHLRCGGTPLDVAVGGIKPPCSICRSVLDAFAKAYEEYSKSLDYDKSSGQPETDKAKLKLSDTELGNTPYPAFVAAFNKAVHGA